MPNCLTLKKSNCKNCYKCIRHCPVKAIRFSGNQAHIIGNECILCGQCFVVCPQDAKEIVDETEKVKVLLARALFGQPDMILLDEPTTYLDVRHQLELMKMLKKLAQSGKSIVTVMHDLPFAFEFSDEIAVLDEGRIKIQAPPSELCDSAILGDIFGIRMGRIEGKDKYYYEI